MDMAGHGRMMAEVDGVRVAIRSTVLYHSTLIMKRAEVIYHQACFSRDTTRFLLFAEILYSVMFAAS